MVDHMGDPSPHIVDTLFRAIPYCAPPHSPADELWKSCVPALSTIEPQVLTINGDRIVACATTRGGIAEIIFGHRESDNTPVAVRMTRNDKESDVDLPKDRLFRETVFLEERSRDPVKYWPELLDIGENKGRPCNVVEFIPGYGLRQFSLSYPAIASLPQMALAVGIQLAHAVTFYENDGWVVRDLLPANIKIVRPSGDKPFVRLFDANLVQKNGYNITSLGMVYGRLAYTSPERARCEAYDQRADIYGIGCTLYEMLAGRRRYTEYNNMDLLLAVRTGDLPPGIPNIPAELNSLVFRLLAKNPDDRPRTGDEAWRLLRKYYLENHGDDPLTQFIGPAITDP